MNFEFGQTVMSIFKKKRFKFQVDLLLADLSDIPYVNAVLFAKLRLLDGGNFVEESPRLEVLNHHVCWGKLFQFMCRISSNPATGILEPCICRISVRKELKGGKAFEKMGFVDVNLSEYAGSGVDGQTRSYIMEGYNAGPNRQDNSLLRINVSMMLQSSDPFFKVPFISSLSLAMDSRRALSDKTLTATEEELNPTERRAPSAPTVEDCASSVHSSATSSSGFDSLSRRNHLSSHISAFSNDEVPTAGLEWLPGHSRNPSCASVQSSGHASSAGPGVIKTHSRQNSVDSMSDRRHSDVPLGNERYVKRNSQELISKRIGSTRIDAQELIDDLLKGYNLSNVSEENNESSGLQLYISKQDGRAALGVPGLKSAGGSGACFEPVIIDQPS